MKWFLLKRYATPTFDLAANPALFAIPMVLSAVAVNAYALTEDSLWFAAALAIVGVVSIPHRPSAFEAALPIRGRDIALARLLSALGLSFATLALSVAISAPRTESPIPGIHYGIACVTVLLGVLTPRLMKPAQFAISPLGAFPPLLVLLAAVVVSFNYLPDVATLSWLSVATIVAAVVWWRVVPNSYQAAAVSASARASASRAAVSSETVTWWKMPAMSLLTVQRVFNYVLLAFGGATGQWWLLILSGTIVEDVWQRTRWMQSLPISRRARFWIVYGSGALVPVTIMVLAAQIHIPALEYAHNLSRRAPGTYRQEAKWFDSPTNVSMEYWNRAPNGVVPTIVAPWGETAEPYIIRVFSAVYYHPYSSRYASSKQFAEWQFRRLTTAVYGFPVELKDYDRKAVQPKRMTETPRMLVLHAAAVLSVFMVFLFLMGLAKIYRFWKHTILIVTCSSIVTIGPMLFSLFVVKRYGMKQGTTDIVFPLIERQFLQLSAALPSSIFVVILLAALPVLAMYALLEWQFNRSETVGAMLATAAR